MNSTSTGAERLAHLAATLADFGQYPPESNMRDGSCFLCLVPVAAGAGVVALGSDTNGTFAVTLHKGCADKADAAMDAGETVDEMAARHDDWMFGPQD
jgi:hypothetical protein